MAGNAAAVCGARIGSRIAKTGGNRHAFVTAQDDVVQCFKDIFQQSKAGNSQERLQKAMMKIPKTQKGTMYAVNYPGQDDLEFMAKVADTDNNGEVDVTEACFAFRVWLCWQKLYPRIVALYSQLDKDGNGVLDATEVEPYLVRLNDGEEVTPTEVFSVIYRADANGDGSLDTNELTFATAIWYADIDRKKLMKERKKSLLSSRASQATASASVFLQSASVKTYNSMSSYANDVICSLAMFGGRCCRCRSSCMAKLCCRRRRVSDSSSSSTSRDSANSFRSGGPSDPPDDADRDSFKLESREASCPNWHTSPRPSDQDTAGSDTSQVRVKKERQRQAAGVGDLESERSHQNRREDPMRLESEYIVDRGMPIVEKAVFDKAKGGSNLTGSTMATGSPPSEPMSEAYSADHGYPCAPTLVIIHRSPFMELMSEDNREAGTGAPTTPTSASDALSDRVSLDIEVAAARLAEQSQLGGALRKDMRPENAV